jgi:hypothetical protein
VQIFYIDQDQVDEWAREILAGLPDDMARRQCLADPSWRAKPGFYFAVDIQGQGCLEGPFDTWDEAYEEAERSRALALQAKGSDRVQ